MYDGIYDFKALKARYLLKNIMGANVTPIALTLYKIRTVIGLELAPDTVMGKVNNLDILVFPSDFKEIAENT